MHARHILKRIRQRLTYAQHTRDPGLCLQHGEETRTKAKDYTQFNRARQKPDFKMNKGLGCTNTGKGAHFRNAGQTTMKPHFVCLWILLLMESPT